MFQKRTTSQMKSSAHSQSPRKPRWIDAGFSELGDKILIHLTRERKKEWVKDNTYSVGSSRKGRQLGGAGANMIQRFNLLSRIKDFD